MHKKILIIITILLGSISLFLLSSNTFAATCGDGSPAGQIQCGITGGSGVPTSATPDQSLSDTVKVTIQYISIAIGIAAVIMIIVGGFRYTTSGGDSTKVSNAKSTILYALIGLVVATLAQIMVHFVLFRVANPSTGGTPPTGKPCVQLPNSQCAPGTGP